MSQRLHIKILIFHGLDKTLIPCSEIIQDIILTKSSGSLIRKLLTVCVTDDAGCD